MTQTFPFDILYLRVLQNAYILGFPGELRLKRWLFDAEYHAMVINASWFTYGLMMAKGWAYDPADCISCFEPEADDVKYLECPMSRRPCGHHCNCSWTQDRCHWCGVEFGESPSPGL